MAERKNKGGTESKSVELNRYEYQPLMSGKKIRKEELGTTGIQITSGYITEDYNIDLQWPQAGDIYERMRKGDGTIAAIIRSIILPIVSADYFIEPVDDSDAELEKAEYIRSCIFEKIEFYNSFLPQACLCFPFGYSLFEKVSAQDAQGRWYYKKVPARLPRSVEHWLNRDESGQPGVYQLGWSENQYKAAYIPGQKLVRFTLDQEGDNYEGISILRAAYKHWYFKEQLEKITGIAAERNGVGVPLLERTNDVRPTEEDRQNNQKVLSQLKANEAGYIDAGFGNKISILTSNGQYKIKPYLEYHKREIAKSVLAQFIETGSEGTSGGYAQVESEQEMFLKNISFYARYIVEIINQQMIRELVDWNYGVGAAMPKLRVSGIEKTDLKSLAQTVKDLVPVGALSLDVGVENMVRRELGLEELTQEEYDQMQASTGAEISRYAEVLQADKKKGAKKNKNKRLLSKDTHEYKKLDDMYSSLANHTHEHHNCEFSEEGKYFRELTLAEQRLDITRQREFLNNQESALRGSFERAMQILLSRLPERLQQYVQTGEMPDMTEVERKNLLEAKNEVGNIALLAFNFGKDEAVKEMGAPNRPKTDQQVRSMADSTARYSIDKTTIDAETSAVLATSTAIMRGESADAAITAATEQAQSLANRAAQIFAGLTAAQFMNRGIEETYAVNQELIWGYQYSAILDDRTTTMCLSLDGRVSKDSKDIPMPPLHPNCRSRRVAVLTEQDPKPPINLPPKSVTDKISPNPFETRMPKTPTNVKDSPAKEEIENRKND